MRRLINISLFFYIAGTICTALLLIRLPNDLVYKAGIINPLEISKAQGVFNLLYFVGGFTFIVGLVAIYSLINHLRVYKQGSIANYNKDGKEIISEETHEKTTSSVDVSENNISELKTLLVNIKNESQKFDIALNFVCKKLKASQGTIYQAKQKNKTRSIELAGAYAYTLADSETLSFEFGEGLAGQVAKSESIMNLESIPNGYMKMFSGLGSSTSGHLVILPIMAEDKLLGVAEIASFQGFSKQDEVFLTSAFSLLGSNAKKVVSKKIKTKKEDAE